MTTLKFIPVLFIILAVRAASYPQTNNEKINAIRQVFQRINADTTLEELVLENADFLDQMPDGGGCLTGYFKNWLPVKIIEWIGLSFGIKQTVYYFDNGKLNFVYTTEKHFKYNDSLQQVDHSNLKLAYEGRYYFYKDKLIGHKTQRTGSGDDSKSLKQLFVEDAARYYKLLSYKIK